MTEKTYKGVYLILSLKWSDSAETLLWWGADNCGYTADIDKAGRYSAEKVSAKPGYYDNDQSTRAVPLYDVMEGILGPVRRVVDAKFRYPTKSFECHGCERSITHNAQIAPETCHRCGGKVCDICADERTCNVGLKEHGGRSAIEESRA